MKKIIFCLLLVLFLCGPNRVWAEAPHELAGFVLGGYMHNFKDQVESDTVIPVRYLESLKEVEAKEINGFKTGLVTYATCIEPARIVRLKFKYADSSQRFFEELLQRYREKLGKPDEWRGDPFHIVIAWKWRFSDKDNNRISLILQHNTKDEQEKIGNSVKLTDTTLMEKDLLCYKNKQLDYRERLRRREWKAVKPEKGGWELFVPR